jgi:heterodisulfide reductase subunit B
MDQTDDIPNDYYLFKSCVADSLYPGIELSVKYVLDQINAGYKEDPRQSSCAGFGVYSGVVPLETNLALNARNISLASETDNTDLVCLCSSCYSNLKHCQKLLSKEKNLEKDAKVIMKKIGMDYKIDLDIRHVSDVFLSRINDLKNTDQMYSLSGINVVTHHGCHYSKFFFKDIISGTFERPTVLDEILKGLGCDVVDYSEQFLCCGGGLHGSVIDCEYSRETLLRKLSSINEVKPDIIITQCPGCSFNLEHYQEHLIEESYMDGYIPVLYISELISILMGADPENLGIDMHVVPIEPFIRKLKVIK